MLAGHMFQLPPVKAAGTWFLDLLRAVRRDRGTAIGKTLDREQTRNFAEGLRVLRTARRFDLTHNFRAAQDPVYARNLDTLCDVDCDTSLAPVLDDIASYDPTEEEYRFGPFVVLSNAERQFINSEKMMEYAKLHKLPILRWKLRVPGLDLDDALYDHEPGLWGYFVEGAPIQLNVTINSSRGVANGSPALMHSLQFTSAPHGQVQLALEQSGAYTGPLFVDIPYTNIGNLVVRMSGADWHGVPLADLTHVLPVLPNPADGTDMTGLAVIPLRDPDNRREARSFHSIYAAQHSFRSAKLTKYTFELAFAITDYKLQGMTLQRLIIVAGKPIPPLKHSRSSAYVQLSRVQLSNQNRLLLPDAEGRKLLECVQQREELVIFERAYTSDGVFCVQRALDAYDELHPQSSTSKRQRRGGTRRRLDMG